jgi:hypothetical protein
MALGSRGTLARRCWLTNLEGGGVNPPLIVASRPGDLAGRPHIIADGALAPPMTSFVAPKAFSKSVDATSTHDATLGAGASLNRGIILMAAAVDRALKGFIARQETKKALEER